MDINRFFFITEIAIRDSMMSFFAYGTQKLKVEIRPLFSREGEA